MVPPPPNVQVKKESDIATPDALSVPPKVSANVSSVTTNNISSKISLISPLGNDSATSIVQSTPSAVVKSELQDNPKDAQAKGTKRKVPCKPAAPIIVPPSGTPPANGGVVAPLSPKTEDDSFWDSSITNYLDWDMLEDVKPDGKKFKAWEPVRVDFDPSDYQPSKPLADVNKFELVKPKTALANIIHNLEMERKPTMVLRKIIQGITYLALMRYHKENSLPVPQYIEVVSSIATALIQYHSLEDLYLSAKHRWTVGVVDTKCLKNPLKDRSVWFRISLRYDKSYITEPLYKIGSMLAAFGIRVIAADFAKDEDSNSLTIYVRGLKDYRGSLKLKGPLLALNRNGKDVTVLTPCLDLAVSKHREVGKLCVRGLPQNCSEEKTLDLLRSTAASLGFEKDSVMSFHLHFNTGNLRSTFGFAQIFGQEVAEALIKSKISVKGGSLAISYASRGKSDK